MKIVIFIGHTRPYGGERVAIDLARSFAAGGHQVTYVANYNEPDVTPELHLGTAVTWTTLARKDTSVTSMITSLLRLRRLLRNMRPDVVVSFMPAANMIAALAATTAGTQVPLVMTEHNIASVSYGRGWRRPRWLYSLLVRILYKRAAAVVAVSRAVADDIASLAHLPPEGVRVIPNPVDAERVRALALQPCVARPWGRHRRLLVSVAALKPAKRPLLLLDVMRSLPEDYGLVMVGDGPLSAEVEREASSLPGDRILLTGWVDNPHPWVANADALVLLSSYEGFGLVVAEAAALGVPAITTAAGGLAETTTLTGGRLVQDEDPRAIAAVIQETVENPPQANYPEALRPDVAAASYLRLLSRVVH